LQYFNFIGSQRWKILAILRAWQSDAEALGKLLKK
jgi:hypothetical protein